MNAVADISLGSQTEIERIKDHRRPDGTLPIENRYYRNHVMTWAEFELKGSFAYNDPVYGFPWLDGFIARAKLNPRTLRRWKHQDFIPGPARAMVNAHWLMRQYGLDIDNDV